MTVTMTHHDHQRHHARSARRGRNRGPGAELALFVRRATAWRSAVIWAAARPHWRVPHPGAEPARESLEVPSPTFTLVQTYDDTRVAVAHFDFYRLKIPPSLAKPVFHDFLQTHLVVVEWPDRLPGELPEDRLDIALEIRWSRPPRPAHRPRNVERKAGAYRGGCGVSAQQRLVLRPAAASQRRCLDPALRAPRGAGRAHRGADGHAVSSRRPGDPNGRSYSAIAHLAEGCRAVVAINAGLREAGLSAPELYAADSTRGSSSSRTWATGSTGG
jgi:N-acetylmuramate 1-kinase